jgi:hypothetical protein
MNKKIVLEFGKPQALQHYKNVISKFKERIKQAKAICDYDKADKLEEEFKDFRSQNNDNSKLEPTL